MQDANIRLPRTPKTIVCSKKKKKRQGGVAMSANQLVPLPQGAGYGVVVGVGLAFGIGMVLVNRFLERFLNERSDHTEMYAIAVPLACI